MSGHFTDEEMKLDKTLKERISNSGGTDLMFFQSAYYNMYLKQYNCIRDLQTYKDVGTIPHYVIQFIS